MKKKIRAKVPDFILEILKKDQNHFRIRKETLCNKILLNFSNNITINTFKNPLFDTFEYFQFSLDKTGQELYTKLIEKLQINNESELIREIFLNYALSHSFIREACLFKEKLKFFQYLIEKKENLKLHTPDGFIESKIKNIFRDKEMGYILVQLNNDKIYYLSHIQVLN